eukprot:7744142-Pyramimonas_sp.AAC.1
MRAALHEWEYLDRSLKWNPDGSKSGNPVEFKVDSLRVFAEESDSEMGSDDEGDLSVRGPAI